VIPSDAQLIQIVDAAFAQGALKSGPWVVCRAGCNDCCLGPFEITPLDAMRLAAGLSELQQSDPARAASLLDRARAYPDDETDDDIPCPALDPQTGLCDLYAFRPITCRSFGPAVRIGNSIGACDLCYHGASDEEIAACAVEVDPSQLEQRLLDQLAGKGLSAVTTVAAVLKNRPPR
jgi:Fe-S-cluster containining protein